MARNETIGVIGLGVMGGPMCRNFAQKHAGRVLMLDRAPAAVAALAAAADPQTLLSAVSKGSGDSFVLRNHGMKAMLPRRFPDKAFPPEYVLKDLDYLLELARDVAVRPAVAELARRTYDAARRHGLSGRYFPGVIEYVDAGGGADDATPPAAGE